MADDTDRLGSSGTRAVDRRGAGNRPRHLPQDVKFARVEANSTASVIASIAATNKGRRAAAGAGCSRPGRPVRTVPTETTTERPSAVVRSRCIPVVLETGSDHALKP
ncbi:MAG: hypothetical protein QOH05_4722 [Acetobacteraceae bacterium]|nr:hypothetical protein [Acetobacteraceae bacterium]